MKYIYTVLLCLFLAVTNIQADNLTQPFSLVPCPVSLVCLLYTSDAADE